MVHVLLAVDETEASKRAAQATERLFGGGDARITAVNVARLPAASLPPVPYGGVYGWPWSAVSPGAGAVIGDGLEQEAAAGEAVAARQAPPGAEAEVLLGDTVQAILAAADDQDVDVVVVGSNDHSFLDRLLSSSVSERVTRHADRPVLVVP